MMDWNTNTARKLKQNVQPERQLRPQSLAAPVNQTVPFSKFECLLTTVCAAIVVVMMIILVANKISIGNAQRQLQSVQTKISAVNNSNISQREEISDLTSQSHLNTTAVQYNFKDANSDVRNVNQ